MKTKLLFLMVLTGSAVFAGTRVSVGVTVGGPAYDYYEPPPPAVMYVPTCPGPGYTWVAGYWYGDRPHRNWRTGYWAPPRYYRPRYVAPRYVAPRYVAPRYYDRDRGFDRRDYRDRDRRHDRDRDRKHDRDNDRRRRH